MEHVLLTRVAVEVGVLVFVGIHHAAADVASIGQRTGYVGIDTPLIPGAGRQIDACLRCQRGPFAHEIDRRRGVAGAGHQAVGAANHLHSFVHGGVQITLDVAVDEGHGVAVVLEVGDVEAASGVVGAVGFDFLHLHARHRLERIVDAGELEVAQLGAAQGGNRLRRLPRGQVELGRSTAGHGLVAVDLGRCTVADHGLSIELELPLLAGHGMVETAGGRNRHGHVGFSAEQGRIS